MPPVRLPGGIQLNLVLNFVLLALAFAGFALLLRENPSGYVFGLTLAVAGVAAFVIHAFFLLAGDTRFRLPTSVAVLGGTLVVSLGQAALMVARLRA